MTTVKWTAILWQQNYLMHYLSWNSNKLNNVMGKLIFKIFKILILSNINVTYIDMFNRSGTIILKLENNGALFSIR